MEKDIFYKLDFFAYFSLYFHDFLISRTTKKWLVPNRWQGRVIKVYRRRLRVHKGWKRQKRQWRGVSSGGSGGGSGGSGGAVGGSDGNRKVLSGRFIQQLENRPPAAAPKRKKPYVWAFQEMRKLQHTTKLCISKYQMAR